MKDLVEYIVKSLVTKPDGVSVEETNSEEGVNLLLKVDPEDMGLVIGKAGQTIKAIRRLVLIRAEGGRRSGNQEESNESEGTEEPKDEEIENPEKAEDAEEPKAEETVEPEK